jgi:hypothetical protein
MANKSVKSRVINNPNMYAVFYFICFTSERRTDINMSGAKNRVLHSNISRLLYSNVSETEH